MTHLPSSFKRHGMIIGQEKQKVNGESADEGREDEGNGFK